MLPNVISVIKNIVSDEDYKIHPLFFVAVNPQYLKDFARKYENDEDFARLVICNEIAHNHDATHLQYIIIRPDALAYRIFERRLFHKRYIKASLKIIKNNPELYSRLFSLTQKLVKSYKKYSQYTIKDLDYVFVNRDFIKFYAKSRGSSVDDAEIDLFLELDSWETLTPQRQYIISRNIIIHPQKLIEILREEKHVDEELVLQHIKFKPSLNLLDRIMKQLSQGGRNE
jgi:hypothetical protein